MAPQRCAHCGQVIPPKVKFSGTRGVIYAFILAQDHPPSSMRIASHVYAGRMDGGPLYAAKTVQVQIFHMNKVLRPQGVRLASPNGSGYRLLAVTSPEV